MGVDDADVDALLAEQLAYYRARAGEYDLDMWESELEPRLRAEVADLEQALADFAPTGAVLELGCGTGTWTRRLTQWATTITAVDASPEMITRARGKVRPYPVNFVVADLFSWTPPRRFDVVFFSFVPSHVPPQRFDAFWNLVRSCLGPRGRVFFIDAASGEAAHETPTPISDVRSCADGCATAASTGLSKSSMSRQSCRTRWPSGVGLRRSTRRHAHSCGQRRRQRLADSRAGSPQERTA